MKDRIQRLLINEGLTPSRMADLMQVQRSSVSHILAGRNKPSMDFMTKLMQSFPSVSGHWLLTGQGEMYLDGRTSTQVLPVETSHDAIDLFKESDSVVPDKSLAEPVTIEAQAIEKTVQNNSAPVNSSKKRIKKIIVIYDDYSTEEIYKD